MIIDQAVEELGGWNDAAIDYWSQISGVDIRSIDENTPFDIEVANRLLATFPEVLNKFKKPQGEPEPEEVVEGISEAAEELVRELEAEEPQEQVVAEGAPPEEEREVEEVEEPVTVEEVSKEEPEVEEVLEEVAEMAEALTAAMAQEPEPQREEAEELEEVQEPEEVAPEVVEELAEAAKVMESLELPSVNLEPFKGVPGLVAAGAFYQGKMVAKEVAGEVSLEPLGELIGLSAELFRKLLGKGERKFDSLVLSLGNMHVLGMPKGDFYIVAVMKAERLGAALAFFREALKRVEEG